jgi:transposase-like protein
MTLHDVNPQDDDSTGSAGVPGRALADRRPKKTDEQQAAVIAELVRAARANGDAVTGPGGLLKQLTKMVLEASLEEEMTEHLGHAKHGGALEQDSSDADADPAGQERISNIRNGSRTKNILTDNVGKVDIQVPRDRAGTFEPVIVPKHQRKLGSVETLVLSLTAKGLTSGEISAHLEEIYGASVSKDTICRITDRVSDEMNDWLARPLDPRRSS